MGRNKSVICIVSDREVVNYTWSFASYNTATFTEFLRVSLIGYAGYHLILDNVAFHRSKAVSALLAEYGVTPLFIDPYTPEQNPIEEVFSSVKSQVRAACPGNNIAFTRCLGRAMQRQTRRQLGMYFSRAVTA